MTLRDSRKSGICSNPILYDYDAPLICCLYIIMNYDYDDYDYDNDYDYDVLEG